jgi:hypothetical protein
VSSPRFRDIVLTHYSRYPLSQIEDFYKLAHQAALGSEHAVKDIAAARKWLLRELDEMAAGPPEALIDEISADGRIVRVHLRPFIESGGDPEILLQAFIRTANEYQGSVELMGEHWGTIDQLAKKGDLPFQPASLRSYIEVMESMGFPAVHHSTQYQEAYQPSYRVVIRDFLSINS